MDNFLLEILVEEIPARFQGKVRQDFEQLLIAGLEAACVKYDNVRTFITPRRIVAVAKLESETVAFVEEKKGPQISASSEVINKFLVANNISRENCVEKEVNGKTFLYAQLDHASRRTADVLPDIICNAIRQIPWARAMHWGEHTFHFVRPLRQLFGLFNGDVLSFSLQEIGVSSCDHTVGHRFLAPQAIYPRTPDDYFTQIGSAFVIVDQNERKNKIADQLKKISAQITDDLLDEVTGLVEYPVVLVGHIPEQYMSLPREVIVTPMKVHQKYFPIVENGELAPKFAIVANNIAADGGATIINGNERVLNARLSDALFFFDVDRKKHLVSYRENLRKIVFQEQLGTVLDRTDRIASVCGYLCDLIRTPLLSSNTRDLLVRTAELAKCDLSTNMVGEFPELQGIMGSYYAKLDGEDQCVCDAIRDQYSTADDIETIFSALYFMADQLELIVAFFSIGKEPTGSKDPFALRRAAIGVLKIIRKFDLSLDLLQLVRWIAENLFSADVSVPVRVINFIFDRLRVMLKNENIPHDIIDLMLKRNDDVALVCKRASVWCRHVDEINRWSDCIKRIQNIVADNVDTTLDTALLREPAEIDLFNSLNSYRKLDSTVSDDPVTQQLKAMIELEKVVTVFFDEILVNSPDKDLRKNRINLLTSVLQAL